MEKSKPGEIWKKVKFNFDYANDSRLEVSNLGRVRSFNKLSDGNILEGSLINGYKIIRLKFFTARDEKMVSKLAYLEKQIIKFAAKIRLMVENRESKAAIKEANALLASLKKNLKQKYADDTKSRTINYHSLIHRLVAEYFVKKPARNHTVVSHLNYDKLNNKASNLMWMTHEENVEHQRHSPYVIAEKEIRRNSGGRTSRTVKLTVIKVMLLKKLLNEGKPVKSLVKQFKVSDMQIYRIKSGENWGDVPAAK
jgi:HNH endonuclease/NUMOD4 motif/Helix-turn-helix domain of resolvase